jgi:hypothetical protein
MMSTDDNSSYNYQDNGAYEPTTLPPSVSPPQRPRNFKECQQSQNENAPWNDAIATVAPIEFLYSVETTTETTTDLSPLSLEAKEAIMSSVSDAIIESIYEYDCPLPQQRALSLFSSRSRRRRMEIQSISSPGYGHVWLGECISSETADEGGISTSNDSRNIDNDNNNNIVESSDINCNEIDGTVLIGFDENGSSPSDFNSVGTVVLSRIQEDMTNGNYLEHINADMEKFNVTITKMKYIDSDYLDLVDQDVLASLNSGLDDVSLAAGTEQIGMTLFSKAAIPVMVILFVLAMAFCWCALMSGPAEAIFWKNNKKKKEEFDEGSEGNIYSKSTLHKPKAKDLRYTNAHPHKLSSRSSTMDVPRNSGRDGRISLKGKDDKDLPSSSYCNGDNNNNNKRRKNHNQEEDEVLSPSLEATLKDLTEAELKSFGNESYAMTRRQTFSSLPMGNTINTRGNRFLTIPTRRSRSQSMIHAVEVSHPASDTETDYDKSGCSSNVSGLHDENSLDSMGTENKIDFVKVDDIQSVSSKPNKKKKPRQVVHHQEQSTPPILPSSRRLFSSFFTSKDNRKETPSRNPSSAINFVERVTACTSDNIQCLGDTEEMPAPYNNTNNVVLNYIPGSSNPLRATQVPPVPTISTSSSARMSTKKSAAYRDYINKKMLLRNHSLERNHSLDGSLYEDVPMEIGLKKSFVDERGKIREMVAL